MSAKKKSRKLLGPLFLFILLAFAGFMAYTAFLKPNVYLDGKKYKFIYIPTHATYEDLLNLLEEENTLQDKKTFEWMAKAYDLKDNFKAGKYRVIAGMTNRQLINMLKSGKQEKVKIIFNSSDRTNEDLIEKISDKLEISEDELEAFFDGDNSIKDKYNFTADNLKGFFVPQTYELNWNTSLPDFMTMVEKNYNAFWSSIRRQKARQINLSVQEVTTLASIVQCESSIKEEQQKIAGVYINRLRKNMPLQADPTLIYALGDFSVKRVRNGDKDVESPYNTYTNKGLPPGPICIPYAQSIDAVLNYNKHSFLYFCAKPDLSGYSNYSITYQEHRKHADAYQKEMDKRGINR